MVKTINHFFHGVYKTRDVNTRGEQRGEYLVHAYMAGYGCGKQWSTVPYLLWYACSIVRVSVSYLEVLAKLVI